MSTKLEASIKEWPFPKEAIVASIKKRQQGEAAQVKAQAAAQKAAMKTMARLEKSKGKTLADLMGED